MNESSRVRISGPLAPYAPDLIDCLAGRGYQDHSAAEHVRRLALLSRWLEWEHLDASTIDDELVKRMLSALHRTGRRFKPCTFNLVVDFLRSRGVVPAPTVLPPTPIELLLNDYRDYLVVERSIAPLTLITYMADASRFVSATCGDDPGRVTSLCAGDVSSFVLQVARVRSPRSVSHAVVGVRSLLRYFYLRGLIDKPLALAAPWLAHGNSAALPRTLAAGHAQLLLENCDRQTLSGARSFALITVFVRLGLRVGEVAAMELDDLDWRSGKVTIRSKGSRRDLLPIPVDVGDALVAYLERRGYDVDHRHVFLHVRAPRGPMTVSTICSAMHEACRRAGIPDTGTHLLRHGAASAMLANGAPLHEIGQVLRHQDLKTTALYAKVDFAALATVAQPWPGDES